MKETKPKVSIILPVYNVAPYVGECIESILKQTYENFELIIIDDGSSDDTNRICPEYALKDSRIKLITQDNSGVVSARKNGIRIATGMYLTFVDGDDWISPTMLENMVANIGTADLLCSGVMWEEKAGVISRKRDSFKVGNYKDECINELKSKMIFDSEKKESQALTAWLCTKLFKLDLFRGLSDQIDENIYFYEDALLVYRYALLCKEIVFIDDYPYHYRFREESASHKKDSGALCNINNVYKGLLDLVTDETDPYCIKEQADNWLLEKCYFTLNERMNLNSEGRIIRYLLDQSDIHGQSVAIYGAGRVGSDIYAQLNASGKIISVWVDKRSSELSDARVESVDKLLCAEYDVLLIAIENRKTADSIKTNLISKGIPDGKIRVARISKLF